MKNNFLTILLFLLATTVGFSQGKFKEKREKIKALKIAYITNELALTTDEATKFWPLFNAFEKREMEIRGGKRRDIKFKLDDVDLDKMTDKDALNLINTMESSEEELFQLRKKFILSLKGVLPPVKILKLKRAEEAFHKKLLKQYKEQHKE